MKMIIHYTTSVCKALFVGVTTTVGVSCRMAFFCDDINTHKGRQNEKDNRAIMAGKYCSKTLGNKGIPTGLHLECQWLQGVR